MSPRHYIRPGELQEHLQIMAGTSCTFVRYVLHVGLMRGEKGTGVLREAMLKW